MVAMMTEAGREWRCWKCHRLMLEYIPVVGLVLRRRCDRCGTWNELRIEDTAA